MSMDSQGACPGLCMHPYLGDRQHRQTRQTATHQGNTRHSRMQSMRLETDPSQFACVFTQLQQVLEEVARLLLLLAAHISALVPTGLLTLRGGKDRRECGSVCDNCSGLPQLMPQRLCSVILITDVTLKVSGIKVGAKIWNSARCHAPALA